MFWIQAYVIVYDSCSSLREKARPCGFCARVMHIPAWVRRSIPLQDVDQGIYNQLLLFCWYDSTSKLHCLLSLLTVKSFTAHFLLSLLP